MTVQGASSMTPLEISPTTAANTVSNQFFTQITDGTHGVTTNSSTYSSKYGLDAQPARHAGHSFLDGRKSGCQSSRRRRLRQVQCRIDVPGERDAAGGHRARGQDGSAHRLRHRRTMTRPSRRCPPVPRRSPRRPPACRTWCSATLPPRPPIPSRSPMIRGRQSRRLMRHQSRHPRALTTRSTGRNSPVASSGRRAMLPLPVRFTGFNNGSYFAEPGAIAAWTFLATLLVCALPAPRAVELLVAAAGVARSVQRNRFRRSSTRPTTMWAARRSRRSRRRSLRRRRVIPLVIAVGAGEVVGSNIVLTVTDTNSDTCSLAATQAISTTFAVSFYYCPNITAANTAATATFSERLRQTPRSRCRSGRFMDSLRSLRRCWTLRRLVRQQARHCLLVRFFLLHLMILLSRRLV